MAALTPGSKLGPYEILSPIGAGGMGSVYRARDSRLGRDVAIKVSAERFSERFEREARAVAALNHPNICTLFDVGPNYLVMELVEGETLAGRIKQGPIALDEALRLASQIAEALGAAHDKGIVHRDFKPGNVMLKPDGSVKVLDFGLAKNIGHGAPAEGSGGQPLDSPTFSMLAATQAGVILGTAAYMAPEQARGKSVDRRVDIWAFGVVLYEMLTGKRLFDGEDMTETLAAVIMKEPDLELIPPQVRRLVKRCLAKDPHKRLRDMGSVTLLLEDGSSPEFATKAFLPIDVPERAPKGLPLWAWAMMGALGLVAVISTVYALRSYTATTASPTLAAANLTMDIGPAEMLGPANFYNRPSRTALTISPDGATVVYAGTSIKEGTRTSMLYRRPLAEPDATPIPGTDRVEYPFFSPDGQWVAFVTASSNNVGKLKKVALSGGPPIDICDLPVRPSGISWGPSGVIVIAAQGLWTVRDSGGKPEVLLKDSPENTQYSPWILPDGQTVLFTEIASTTKWEEAHVDAINITTKQRKTLLPNAADARYSPTGHLVFLRSGALLAVPFDAAQVEITGAAVPLLAGIMQSINTPNSNEETGMGQYAISANGTLLYAYGGIYPTPATTMVRVDRKGGETKLADVKGGLFGLRISQDGRRLVALKINDGSRASDLWQYQLPAGTPTRLTSNGIAVWPLWAPDRQTITFTQGLPDRGIYALPVNGGSPQQILAPQAGAVGFMAASWSPDGKWLAYLQTLNNVLQIFVRPMVNGKPESGDPRQFSPSSFTQRDAEFSPDGRWIAYVTTESGGEEVYVQPFPGPGEKHRVSLNGGFNPAWSPNQREIYYIKPNPPRTTPTARRSVSLMAADITTTGAFGVSGHRALFEGPYLTSTPLRNYDVTPDGQFVTMKDEENPPDQRVTRLNVVLGWGEALKHRVPSSPGPK